MNTKIFRIVFIFAIIVLAGSEIVAQGCSQCRLIPQSNMEGGGSIGAALNPAILYLMAVPYIILVFIFRKQIVTLYKNLRNKKPV